MILLRRVLFFVVHVSAHVLTITIPALVYAVRSGLVLGAHRLPRRDAESMCVNCAATLAPSGRHGKLSGSAPLRDAAALCGTSGTRYIVPADKRFCARYLSDDGSTANRREPRMIVESGSAVDALFRLTAQRQQFLREATAAPLYGEHVSTIVPALLRVTSSFVLHREVVTAHDAVDVALDWGRSSWYFEAATGGVVGHGAASGVTTFEWCKALFAVDSANEAAGAARARAVCHADAAFYNAHQRADLKLPRAVIAILPGLTSTCGSFYIVSLMRLLLRHGYDPVLVNTRGLGVRLHRPAKFLCAAFTDDVRAIIKDNFNPAALRRRYHGLTSSPDATVPPVLAIGFSMGANVLCKLLAEDGATEIADRTVGTTCHRFIEGAIAVSAPWDFFASTVELVKGVNYYMYNRSLVEGVKHYIEANAEGTFMRPQREEGEDPTPSSLPRPAPCLEICSKRSRVTLRQLDDFVVAPHHGYSGAEAYYRDAEAFRRLHTVRRPLLAISAVDDPIVGPARPDAQWERVIAGLWLQGGDTRRPTTWEEHDVLLQRQAEMMHPIAAVDRPPIAYVRLPSGGHIGFLGTPLAELRCEPNVCEKMILRALSNAVDAATTSRKQDLT